MIAENFRRSLERQIDAAIVDARLAFEPDAHVYAVEGRPIPSVTTVLGDVYPPPVFDRAAWNAAAEFGTFVHSAIELALVGDLDRSSLTDSESSCVDAALAFLRDGQLTPLKSEVRVAHLEEWYAGTVDLIAADSYGDIFIIDWKTGSPQRTHALQTAAYRQAVVARFAAEEPVAPVAPKVKRFAVYLSRFGGKYRGDRHDDNRTDWAYFKAALLVRRFRNGGTE